MLQKRPTDTIYQVDGGWFRARWHFSFDRYHDPEHMGIGPLRVFNDDTLVPGAVWPLHPHRDVEGLTYVAEGHFRHEDDQGNDGELPAGAAQRMTLGRGAWHSEQNASPDETVRFIQMWLLPHTPSLPPSCEQPVFTREDRLDRALVIFCPDTSLDIYAEAASEAGVPQPIPVHGHAAVAVASLKPGTEIEYAFTQGGDSKAGYIYALEGEVACRASESASLSTGDALQIFDEERVSISAQGHSELVLVDIPQKYTPVGV